VHEITLNPVGLKNKIEYPELIQNGIAQIIIVNLAK
jgi:hypothetical protein